jgi:adenylate cyclase
MRILNKRWAQVILLLLLLLATVFLRLNDPPVIERLRQLTFDTYNRILPRQAHDDVVIVDIDEESIKRHGQWPWPRMVVGDIPVVLQEMGAKAVIFDMVFSEHDRTSPDKVADRLPAGMEDISAALKKLPDNDSVFAEKIAQAGNVVMGFSAANQKTDNDPVLKAKIMNQGVKPDVARFVASRQHFAAALPVLTSAAAGNGSFTMFPEADGIIRRVPLMIGQRNDEGAVRDVFPSLSVEGLRVAEKKSIFLVKSYGERSSQGYGITNIQLGDYSIPTDERGNIWVYYTGHRPHIYMPAWKVLAREITPEQVSGKIVFVGTSATGLLDLRSSPLNAVVPGVEVHAEIVEQIIHGQYLRRPAFLNGAELVFTIVVGLFIIFISPFIGTGLQALMGAFLVFGGAFGSLYVYGRYGLVLDPVYPTLSVVIIFILSSVLTNLRDEMEKRAVRQAFGQYLSPVLIEELAENPDKLRLGGEVRELSVMFMDIRNFATICEGMDPADMIKLMSDFLTPMTSCVLDSRGTVDKYIGDAMMSFWNAPLDDPEHARHACGAALAMIKALAPVNAGLKEASAKTGKKFMELRAGIGIHAGLASVGNMGSKQRFAYSALGDAVNLAARLEGQTKSYFVSVIISEDVRRQAPEFAAIELDVLVVKGRTGHSRIYALLGDAAMANDPSFRTFAESHDRMLAAYRAREWQAADDLVSSCAALRPDLEKLYAMYRDRIAHFIQNPPADDWAGVWVATGK